MNILKERHTIRNYDPNYVIPKDQLISIIETAQISPSYMGFQDVDFIVVNNRQKLDEIAKACEKTWEGEMKEHILSRREKFHVSNVVTCDASALVYIVRNERASPKVDCDGGIAAMAICVAAADLGLSTMCCVIPISAPVSKIIGVDFDKMIVCVAIGKALPDAHIGKRLCNNTVRFIE